VAPAVLVVDLIRAFTDENLPLGAPLERVLAETSRVLEVARQVGIPILYTSVAYESGDLRDAGLWAAKMSGLMTLRAGTPEVDVDARLGRQADEPLIYKKYASAFFGTDLLTRLNTMRVDTLVITGCTTSGCVRASAVDAVQNGIRPVVTREAVGDRSQAAHDQSLFDLQAKYADVLRVDEVLAQLLASEQVSR
jgi:nicotinamidase-related amidase